jgi:DNA invertase Pin-like site-specific DNA recombinase
MDTTTRPRAVIYTRISQDQTGEQAGVGRQYDECLRKAEALNLDVVKHYSDPDISAYTGKRRPAFEEMLEALQRGEFSEIVVWHVDRLYRSNADQGRVARIAKNVGLYIRTVSASDIDMSGPSGRLLASLLGDVALYEVEHKAERQRAANRARRDAGRWQAFGKVPFGYLKVGEPRHYTLVPKEPEATLLRQAVAHVLAGGSLRSIVRDWNAAGVPTMRGGRWQMSTLQHVLTNPVHAGLVTVAAPGQTKGSRHRLVRQVVARGDWEPLIDEDTHHALVTLLSDPSRRNSISYERRYMGSGVYRCGVCGGKMAASSLRGDARIYICRTVPQSGERVGAHVTRALQPTDDTVTCALMHILNTPGIRARLTRDAVDLGKLRAQRDAWVKTADKLAAMRDGDIDADGLRALAAELDALGGEGALRTKITDADAVLAAATTTNPALALLDGGPLLELRSRWDASSADTRGKIVDQLVTVTIKKVPRGTRFNPESIDITPKR